MDNFSHISFHQQVLAAQCCNTVDVQLDIVTVAAFAVVELIVAIPVVRKGTVMLLTVALVSCLNAFSIMICRHSVIETNMHSLLEIIQR